tara:strand:+ start:2138 stop:2359 length:222 start_codon:yes stop_codon:yes gene_type:complete
MLFLAEIQIYTEILLFVRRLKTGIDYFNPLTFKPPKTLEMYSADRHLHGNTLRSKLSLARPYFSAHTLSENLE